MVEAGTLCTNSNVVYYAGANVSSTYSAEAYTNVYIKAAEGLICAETTYDWVTNYSSISTIGKEALRLATACLAACDVINADMSAIDTKQEAGLRVNILWAKYRELVNLLKDQNVRTFLFDGDGNIA